MSVYEAYYKFTVFSFSEYLLREMPTKTTRKKYRYCNTRFLFKTLQVTQYPSEFLWINVENLNTTIKC